MAAGDHSDFTIYHDEFWAGMWETIDQKVDILNEGSNGTIRLVTQRSKGDFQKETILEDMGAIVTSRNIDATTAKADTAMVQLEMVRPKVNRGIGPVAQTLDAWKKIGSDTSEMSFLVGRAVGEKIAQDMVNTGITAAVTAMGQESAILADQAGLIVTDDLRVALAKAGDMSPDIVAWVMHSAVFFELMKDQIGSTVGYQSLETVAGVVLNEAAIATLGRPVIITDSAKLGPIGATPGVYNTLGLKRNAIVLMESEERSMVSEIVTGLENLVFRIQGEYAYNIGIQGISYTAAAANPADADLETAGNWTTVLHPKLCAGVILQTDDV
jgi:hypothetical protein